MTTRREALAGVILTLKNPATQALIQNASMAISVFNEQLEASGSKRLAMLIINDSMIDVKVVQK
jgi:hypothetical protein